MNRVIVVTGGTGGLGSAVARKFGAAGDKIVLNYGSSDQKAENLVREIKTNGADTFSYKADITDYDQTQKMMADAIAKWGRIDVLVNCAGGGFAVMKGRRLIVEMDPKIWNYLIDLNLNGTFNCIKAVLPQMIKQNDGHIINVSSGVALTGANGQSNYSAAKAGVFGLTKSAAIEAGQYNIKVNALCPGAILHEALKASMPPDRQEALKQMNLLKRTGDPEEFAAFVFHLSTMKNISGQIINLDSRILF